MGSAGNLERGQKLEILILDVRPRPRIDARGREQPVEIPRPGAIESQLDRGRRDRGHEPAFQRHLQIEQEIERRFPAPGPAIRR